MPKKSSDSTAKQPRAARVPAAQRAPVPDAAPAAAKHPNRDHVKSELVIALEYLAHADEVTKFETAIYQQIGIDYVDADYDYRKNDAGQTTEHTVLTYDRGIMVPVFYGEGKSGFAMTNIMPVHQVEVTLDIPEQKSDTQNSVVRIEIRPDEEMLHLKAYRNQFEDYVVNLDQNLQTVMNMDPVHESVHYKRVRKNRSATPR